MTMPEPTVRPFSRVVVPLDGSDLAAQALPYAAALAGADAELNLVRVVPPASPIRDKLGQIVVPADAVERWAEQAARDELAAAAERVRGPGLAVRATVAAGDPATEILRAAAADQADLIVLASHGRGAVGRVAYGSVADRLARHASIPVLVIRGADEQPAAGVPARRQAVLRRLVVPLDGSPLARQALPVASELARRLGLAIHLITVLDPATMASPALAYGAAFSSDVYQETMEGIRQTAEQTLANTAAELAQRGIAVTREIRQGPIVDAIAQATRPGDVIVLTSHGRSGLTRWVLGSVAEKLVRVAPVPVLMVPAPERGWQDREGLPAASAERTGDLLRRDRYRPEELAALIDVDVNVIRTDAFAGRLRAEILDHHIIAIRRQDALDWLAARG